MESGLTRTLGGFCISNGYGGCYWRLFCPAFLTSFAPFIVESGFCSSFFYPSKRDSSLVVGLLGLVPLFFPAIFSLFDISV
ncbi:hypothetical protein J3E74DRAFT_324028, partial [Bipolaris maydis]